MLLTVFGMLSGNGNRLQGKKWARIGRIMLHILTTASKRESIVLNRGKYPGL